MEFTYRILIRFNNEVDEHIGYGEGKEDFFKVLDKIHFMLTRIYLDTQCAMLYLKFDNDNDNITYKYRVNRTTVRYLNEN